MCEVRSSHIIEQSVVVVVSPISFFGNKVSPPPPSPPRRTPGHFMLVLTILITSYYARVTVLFIRLDFAGVGKPKLSLVNSHKIGHVLHHDSSACPAGLFTVFIMPFAVSDIKTINDGGVEQIETIKDRTLVAQTPESLHYKPITEEEKALDRKINWKLDLCVASVLSTGFILCGSRLPSYSFSDTDIDIL